MLRIVKMHFKPTEIDNFIKLFNEVYPAISAFEGCNSVVLLKSIEDATIMFTYSNWHSPEALESYRNSELFSNTWRKIKALFANPAQAWSVEEA